MAYACLFGPDTSCTLTSTTTCLSYPLNSCVPSGMGTYVQVSRSGLPYAAGTTYSLLSFLDSACSVTAGPGLDTGARAESECFALGSGVGSVAFHEPPTCQGRCKPPEPTTTYVCLFGADAGCSLGPSAQCVQFPLDQCVPTGLGTFARVARYGSAYASSTNYSLQSFADAGCTVSLGAAYDSGNRSRSQCFFLGLAQAPVGFVAFHEPSTCSGYCDAPKPESPCNPTTCGVGLQCVDKPGTCGPLNDWYGWGLPERRMGADRDFRMSFHACASPAILSS